MFCWAGISKFDTGSRWTNTAEVLWPPMNSFPAAESAGAGEGDEPDSAAAKKEK